MLDPLSAFSLAGNIAQFVEFGGTIISNTRELIKSSHRMINQAYNTEVVIQDLLRLSKQLKNGARAAGTVPQADDDKALEELCNRCTDLSERMMKRLEKLKLAEGASKRRALLHALKSALSQKELESEEAQLATYRSQLEIRVLASLREKFDIAAISHRPGSFEEAECSIPLVVENRRFFESSLLDHSPNGNSHTIVRQNAEVGEMSVKDHENSRSQPLRAESEVHANMETLENAEIDDMISQKQELNVRRQAENHILRSLKMHSASERYDRIVEAHAATFQWIFKDPAPEDHPWDDFANWLESDGNIYWICGKPGSGKSTLMRYICDHWQTKNLLRSWSGERQLTVASFFFWTNGTPDLKSQNGLLRSLLHQILSQCRDLIPVVLPDQWQDEYVEPVEWRQGRDFQWSRDILRRAFEALRAQHETRVCLFIDGLDEYEGDPNGAHEDIISFFSGLAESANIKICVSSRPWNVFEDAFGTFPNLKLQDLTLNDITRYVDDKINGHERMEELRQIHVESAESLTVEIVSKASGVFLWVKLIVNSLLEGFTHRDRIADLHRRLRELPADLESFYKHILENHIPPRYYEQSSQLFQIMQAWSTSFRVREYPPLPITLETLSFIEDADNDSFAKPTNDITNSDVIAVECRSRDMAARLKSRCGGLLVISPGGIVQYLHSSVRDFLDTPETRELLLSRTGPLFNPDESLFRAYLLHLKFSEVPGGPFAADCRVEWTLLHARRAMDMTGLPYVPLLDELDQVVTHRWLSVPRDIPSPDGTHNTDLRKHGAHWSNFLTFRDMTNDRTLNNRDNFMGLAVSYGLTSYIEAKIKQDPRSGSVKSGQPLLDYIVFSECPVDAEMVSLLLRYGADPNQEFDGENIWRYCLEFIVLLFKDSFPRLGVKAEVLTRLDNPDHRTWFRIFRLLVQAGAHPNVLCMRIQNLRRNQETPQYVAYFSTPATIFALDGLFPDAGLVELIKSRGGITFGESVQLRSIDWDDAEAEAMKVKPAVAQRLQTILRVQKQKMEPQKQSNWRSRRKRQYREHRRYSMAC